MVPCIWPWVAAKLSTRRPMASGPMTDWRYDSKTFWEHEAGDQRLLEPPVVLEKDVPRLMRNLDGHVLL